MGEVQFHRISEQEEPQRLLTYPPYCKMGESETQNSDLVVKSGLYSMVLILRYFSILEYLDYGKLF